MAGRSPTTPTGSAAEAALLLVFGTEAERAHWLARVCASGNLTPAQADGMVPFEAWAARRAAAFGLSWTAMEGADTGVPSLGAGTGAVQAGGGARASDARVAPAAPFAPAGTAAPPGTRPPAPPRPGDPAPGTLRWMPCFVKRESRGMCGHRGVMCPAWRFKGPESVVCADHHPPSLRRQGGPVQDGGGSSAPPALGGGGAATRLQLAAVVQDALRGSGGWSPDRDGPPFAVPRVRCVEAPRLPSQGPSPRPRPLPLSHAASRIPALHLHACTTFS
jgi:hypothetical protein